MKNNLHLDVKIRANMRVKTKLSVDESGLILRAWEESRRARASRVLALTAALPQCAIPFFFLVIYQEFLVGDFESNSW